MPADRPGAVLVIGVQDGKPSVVAAVNEPGRAAGVSANDLVRTAATFLGGKGGGKDDVAQGGGADASKVAEALEAVRGQLSAR
jgi:alanyl-tRNA synthetase